MQTEKRNRDFKVFVAQGVLAFILIIVFISGTNFLIDASEVIRFQTSTQMAMLALDGHIVSIPQNYNERVYQMAIVDGMTEMPETIVIGSSRGMFIGEEITGCKNLYNNCVSGACLEDYYGLIGLYYQRFLKLPPRVIIEISPWVFYAENPEARWTENYSYVSVCEKFYQRVNGHKLTHHVDKENPYLSISYFQYNISMLSKMGRQIFSGEAVQISTDPSEMADLPDGTIRYASEFENASAERLAKVRESTGALTYQSVNDMTVLDRIKTEEYENLLNYLLSNNIEIIIYMQPFSVTQCQYSYDQNLNPVLRDVEKYLHDIGETYGIQIVGGYDARDFQLSDDLFIDSMHLDKIGTQIVWNSSIQP